MTEDILRRYRDAALKIVAENQNQIREGMQQLISERLPDILQNAVEQNDTAAAEAMLELAYTMFALGFTVAKMGKEMPTR